MKLSSAWCHFYQCPLRIGSAEQKGRDMGRWVGAPEGCKQHGRLWAQLWIPIGWHWVGRFCPLVYKWSEKIVHSPCWVPIPGSEAFFPVWMSGCFPRAMTIASSLMGGCGLGHKCIEDGCKGTCVKFGGWKSDRTGDMVSLMHAYAKSDLHRKIIRPAMVLMWLC